MRGGGNLGTEERGKGNGSQLRSGYQSERKEKKSQNTNSGRIDDLVMRTEAKGATTLEMNSGKDQSVCSAK